MLLKNLMEEKQLNYDRPLLSVRRSEKDNESKTDKSLPGKPPLPLYRTELKSGPVTNPGTVPFHWEHRPGRSKEEINPHDENSDRPPIAQKLPPGKSSTVNHHDLQNVQSQDEYHDNFERCNKIIEKESSHSGESDEAYSDALDTFSSSETVFLNCSMSGLSSFDELDVKLSGTFSTDPSTRDDPAAKSMASDTPQSATKEQPIVQEKPRQIKKSVDREKSSMQHGPILIKHYLQIHDDDDEDEDDEDEEEEEEENDEYDHGNSSAVCGLLPRFCLKRSFCLIHPVNAKCSVKKLQGGSSAAGSFSKRDNESRSNFSDRNSVGDQIIHQRQNPEGSVLRSKLQKHRTSMSFDESYNNTEKGVTNFYEETKNQGINGLGSHKKGYKTFGDFLSEKDSSEEPSYSGIPSVEKTVHVDTVQKVKSPRPSKERPCSREKEDEVVPKITDQFPLVDCSLEDINELEAEDGAKLLPDPQKYNDISVESSISNPIQEDRMEAQKVFEPDQEIKKDSTSTTVDNVEVTDKETTQNLQKQPAKTENRGNFRQSRSQFPLPPPSPISPSESWLQRTLPAMSRKNQYIRSHLRAAVNPQKQVSKAQPGDLKWETLVKTTEVQQH